MLLDAPEDAWNGAAGPSSKGPKLLEDADVYAEIPTSMANMSSSFKGI